MLWGVVVLEGEREQVASVIKLYYKVDKRTDEITYCNAIVQGSTKLRSVTYDNGKWTCTCERFTYTKSPCKHIDWIKGELFLRTLKEV
jgi:hypothetical protein